MLSDLNAKLISDPLGNGQKDGPHPKLVTVCLANDIGSSCAQEAHHRRVVRRIELCQFPIHIRPLGIMQRRAPRSISDEHVVGMSFVHIESFTAIGLPARSLADAVGGGRGETATKALTRAFCSVIRRRHSAGVKLVEVAKRLTLVHGRMSEREGCVEKCAESTRIKQMQI